MNSTKMWHLIPPEIVYTDDLINIPERVWGVAEDSFGDKMHTIVSATEKQNAKLISRAPEMYELLKIIYESMINSETQIIGHHKILIKLSLILKYLDGP